MADIGVVHASITAGGGAEAVGVHTVEALVDAGHAVTLYTTGHPDIAVLTDRYGATLPTDVDVVTVESPTLTAVDAATVAARPLGVSDFPLLRQVAFEHSVIDRYRHQHDTLVCTHGEFAVADAVEYIHFPYFSADAMQRYGTRFDETLYPQYHRLCRALKRREGTGNTTALTNSEWTARVVEEMLGRRPQVIYPPVDTTAFDPPPRTEMDAGFVAVGRLHPLKRQHRLIEIIDSLRGVGVDTHLHIVGPVGDDQYAATLADRAESRPYVHLEGELPRAALISLLESHRYGIHGRRFEHFGIAVAEMVASRTIPFVHASGGQQEVVGNIDRLCYADHDDAVEKIASVTASSPLQRTLLDALATTGIPGRPDVFRTAIQEAVDRHLGGR